MTIIKPCFYCYAAVDTTIQDGSFIYTVEAYQPIQFAHTECAEVIDGLIINEIEW